MIIKSEVPAGLVGKGSASASTVAWTMYQKYGNGLSIYLQEKDWKQYGAQIIRTTLANWIIYCSQKYLQPMYDYFHRELLKRKFAMADETRIQVLNEEGRRVKTQSFMWLFNSSVDGANASAVVYTIVEMAKAHGLNIYGYLKFLLEHRPGKEMTDEQMEELAPWSEKLQSIKNRI